MTSCSKFVSENSATTPAIKTSFCMKWSRREELNLRPAVYETAALPLSYTGKKRLSIGAPARGRRHTACVGTPVAHHAFSRPNGAVPGSVVDPLEQLQPWRLRNAARGGRAADPLFTKQLLCL